jgi:hypothetical protein
LQNGKRTAAAAPKTPQPQKKAKVDVKAPKSAPAKVQGKGATFNFSHEQALCPSDGSSHYGNCAILQR